MADISTIISYYVNLLIIQYHNKPKAKATIDLLASIMEASGILFDIQNGYSVDTAVGKQLDIVGKYVGVDRFYTEINLVDFFAVVEYDEVDPDAEEKYGFCTYATYEDFQFNGTLNYQSFLSTTNQLNDDDYRTIIRLKILINNMNYSHAAINDGIYQIFGNDIIPSSNGDMLMYYLVTGNLTPVISAALAKGLLPHPMGVGVLLITGATEPFFGFAYYAPTAPVVMTWGDGTPMEWGDGTPMEWSGSAVVTSPNVLGFTDYSEYDTSIGDTLVYDQIQS